MNAIFFANENLTVVENLKGIGGALDFARPATDAVSDLVGYTSMILDDKSVHVRVETIGEGIFIDREFKLVIVNNLSANILVMLDNSV